MFEKIILEQNKQWEGTIKDRGILREKIKDIVPYLNKKQILVITGIRRCGKSYLLKQLQDHLINHKKSPTNIFFLNLENPYFDEFREKVVYLEKIFEEYLSLTEAKGDLFVFLDEVQFFKHWQVFVKSKYELGGIKFILTGSNSWLLSSEYITLLSGRTIPFELFPFSFKEFLSTKNIEIETKMKIASNERKIKKALIEFMQWGGFPEIVLNNLVKQKKEILINYYNNIIYRDIIPRFNIVNIRQTQELSHYLISNIGKLYSYNQLSKLINLSDKTVKEYIHYFTQGYLLFEINRYNPSIKKQIANLKKVYVGDVGFSKALGFRFSDDHGRFLENMVFIELKRRRKEIYYHKEKEECDFVIREGNRIVEAIQVCYNLTTENRSREIAGLTEAMKMYNVKKGIILTIDQEEELDNISVIPVWKWLLGY